jgi:2,4-dienoyl-CoA reductase-like NADH-dependent reductase (Old Yellow Enzyme family)
MAESKSFVRIPALKSVTEFRRHVTSLGIDLPCDDQIARGDASPLLEPITHVTINGKRVGNRYAVQPMEGWDGTTGGGITDDVRRRWRRFGESGAKVICGGEAMAVHPDGRANPHQLIISDSTKADLAELRTLLTQAHAERFGSTDDLVIGFQLTHSGRFCKPQGEPAPRVAYRHPLLDLRFGVHDDAQIMSDGEVEQLVQKYVDAAKIARDVGADFVDIKHCHGYLLHEFLSAHTRPGRYGGSFENRTRILHEIVSGIRNSGNNIDIAVRLSAFDTVPFRPNPALSQPGKSGPGIPEDFSQHLPYRYGFGVNVSNPTEADLGESYQFARLCLDLGVRILNLSAGSPYYNPHIQRPAAYPPSDGYLPPEDPLIGVARQIQAVRALRESLNARGAERVPMLIIGCAYSYLQGYLPHVGQSVLRQGWADLIGLGRMVLAYPSILAEAIQTGALNPKLICRTFSDCTTAPRNGLVSGCYPLDKYYAAKPEAVKLKALKRE